MSLLLLLLLADRVWQDTLMLARCSWLTYIPEQAMSSDFQHIPFLFRACVLQFAADQVCQIETCYVSTGGQA